MGFIQACRGSIDRATMVSTDGGTSEHIEERESVNNVIVARKQLAMMIPTLCIIAKELIGAVETFMWDLIAVQQTAE